MSKALARLLDKQNNRLFVQCIDDLEAATGRKGIDAKLVGDILRQAHKAIKALKLDSTDSLPLEVYNAACAHYKTKKSLHVDDYVGIIIRERCVSFNEKDISSDIRKNASFNERSQKFLQKSLLTEIIQRYEAATTPDDKVVKRLVGALRKF